ncbi:FkbM family methyltransferase [Pseudodonghicola flavimaris]|uniref:FkbM family methyltransferase n=1 Tax=Pseudodonghicola flavimaris TaxID=3050036 RepID=A0ABT7F1G6_9RHOB|nr:FkbM family methyltransferase [Pseudodonghicola flavimaris]MDK3018350.1 FkbM family methyltransferase [Pseudodonghicola flavimaris]
MSMDGPDPQGKAVPGRRLLPERVAYLRDRLAPARPLRILDVGANPINTPDYDPLLTLGGCEVWGFEPEEKAFAALEANPRPGAHYINKAVGAPGKGTFHMHPQNGLGSLYPIREQSVAFLGHPGWYRPEAPQAEIDLVALDDLDDLPPPDLLKIDIQGGELDVIRHGRQKLSQAVCIIPEVRFYRMYEGEPLWGKLDVELHEQGFVLHKLMFAKPSMVANSQAKALKGKAVRSQLIDGDAVYIRNPEAPGEWSDAQWTQLAIAAGTVFDSFDLAIHCLDRLEERGVIGPEVAEGFLQFLPDWMKS